MEYQSSYLIQAQVFRCCFNCQNLNQPYTLVLRLDDKISPESTKKYPTKKSLIEFNQKISLQISQIEKLKANKLQILLFRYKQNNLKQIAANASVHISQLNKNQKLKKRLINNVDKMAIIQLVIFSNKINQPQKVLKPQFNQKSRNKSLNIKINFENQVNYQQKNTKNQIDKVKIIHSGRKQSDYFEGISQASGTKTCPQYLQTFNQVKISKQRRFSRRTQRSNSGLSLQLVETVSEQKINKQKQKVFDQKYKYKDVLNNKQLGIKIQQQNRKKMDSLKVLDRIIQKIEKQNIKINDEYLHNIQIYKSEEYKQEIDNGIQKQINDKQKINKIKLVSNNLNVLINKKRKNLVYNYGLINVFVNNNRKILIQRQANTQNRIVSNIGVITQRIQKLNKSIQTIDLIKLQYKQVQTYQQNLKILSFSQQDSITLNPLNNMNTNLFKKISSYQQNINSKQIKNSKQVLPNSQTKLRTKQSMNNQYLSQSLVKIQLGQNNQQQMKESSKFNYINQINIINQKRNQINQKRNQQILISFAQVKNTIQTQTQITLQQLNQILNQFKSSNLTNLNQQEMTNVYQLSKLKLQSQSNQNDNLQFNSSIQNKLPLKSNTKQLSTQNNQISNLFSKCSPINQLSNPTIKSSLQLQSKLNNSIYTQQFTHQNSNNNKIQYPLNNQIVSFKKLDSIRNNKFKSNHQYQNYNQNKTQYQNQKQFKKTYSQSGSQVFNSQTNLDQKDFKQIKDIQIINKKNHEYKRRSDNLIIQNTVQLRIQSLRSRNKDLLLKSITSYEKPRSIIQKVGYLKKNKIQPQYQKSIVPSIKTIQQVNESLVKSNNQQKNKLSVQRSSSNSNNNKNLNDKSIQLKKSRSHSQNNQYEIRYTNQLHKKLDQSQIIQSQNQQFSNQTDSQFQYQQYSYQKDKKQLDTIYDKKNCFNLTKANKLLQKTNKQAKKKQQTLIQQLKNNVDQLNNKCDLSNKKIFMESLKYIFKCKQINQIKKSIEKEKQQLKKLQIEQKEEKQQLKIQKIKIQQNYKAIKKQYDSLVHQYLQRQSIIKSHLQFSKKLSAPQFSQKLFNKNNLFQNFNKQFSKQLEISNKLGKQFQYNKYNSMKILKTSQKQENNKFLQTIRNIQTIQNIQSQRQQINKDNGSKVQFKSYSSLMDLGNKNMLSSKKNSSNRKDSISSQLQLRNENNNKQLNKQPSKHFSKQDSITEYNQQLDQSRQLMRKPKNFRNFVQKSVTIQDSFRLMDMSKNEISRDKSYLQKSMNNSKTLSRIRMANKTGKIITGQSSFLSQFPSTLMEDLIKNQKYKL